MADRIFIHIGAPKCGTTYLQTIVWKNRRLLKSNSLLVPGQRRFDHNLAAQFARKAKPSDEVKNEWERVRTEITEWSGDALLSNEWFSMASADQATTFIEQFDPSQVHIIFTARDLTRLVPSGWQESLKLGQGKSLSEFVADMDSKVNPRWNWNTVDPARVLSKWGAELPAANVHLITIPPNSANKDLLWQRFASVIGVDPDSYDLNHARPNESLSAESARFLQLIGPGLRSAISTEGASWRIPYRWIRNYVAHELLVPLRGSKIRLRDDDYKVVKGQAQSSINELRKPGYTVVGDLAELNPAPLDQDAVYPDDVSEKELRDITTVVIPSMLKRLQDQTEVEDQLRTQLKSRTEQMVRPQTKNRTSIFNSTFKRAFSKALSSMRTRT